MKNLLDANNYNDLKARVEALSRRVAALEAQWMREIEERLAVLEGQSQPAPEGHAKDCRYGKTSAEISDSDCTCGFMEARKAKMIARNSAPEDDGWIQGNRIIWLAYIPFGESKYKVVQATFGEVCDNDLWRSYDPQHPEPPTPPKGKVE